MAAQTLDHALGRVHRDDPVREGTGGPAGNARLTAWTGLLLLLMFVAELLTLIDVRGLITWHLAIGALLIPPVLLKTGATTWRVLGYYRGRPDYVLGGPPPLPLRLLGPLVVAASVGLLASGTVLVLIGEQSSRSVLVTVLGQRVDALTLHQAFFVVWAVVTGLHLLARFVPALEATVTGPARSVPVPGRATRTGALVASLVVAALVAVLLVRDGGSWQQDRGRRADRPPRAHSASAPR
jgi:hypothetical protein